MDYVRRLQLDNLQLELDKNAAQVNIVVAQAVLRKSYNMDQTMASTKEPSWTI